MNKGKKVNPNNTETHKQCPQCKEILLRNEYHKDKKSYDGNSTYCKKCSVTRDATAYTKVKERLTQKRRELKIQCLSLLGGKCSRCGYNEFISGLDFHHLRDKSFNIATLIARSARLSESQKTLLFEEVSKCTLLCRNCHNAYHAGEWN